MRWRERVDGAKLSPTHESMVLLKLPLNSVDVAYIPKPWLLQMQCKLLK